MQIDEYQTETARTWRHDLPDALAVIALGIAGEAGEVADYVKKVRAHGKEFRADQLALELGDVLYYLARAASEIGWTLQEIAQANVAKLRARYPSGFSVAAAEAKADEKQDWLAEHVQRAVINTSTDANGSPTDD